MYTKLEILILYTCTCKPAYNRLCKTIDYECDICWYTFLHVPKENCEHKVWCALPTSLWLLFCLHSQYEYDLHQLLE